jgi:hypothetical protein
MIFLNLGCFIKTQLAFKYDDVSLAKVAIKLREKSYQIRLKRVTNAALKTQLSPNAAEILTDYVTLVHISVRSRNALEVVEALVEAEVVCNV